MAGPVTLRILFGGAEDSRKLTFESGIPTSVDELCDVIKACFGLKEEFRLQFMDADFGNEYMNLTSTTEIKDKSTLKLIYLPSEVTITLVPISPTQVPDDAMSLSSYDSNDTVILSSPESSSSRSSSWPDPFVVPYFSYDAEVQLERGNAEFTATGTYFNPGHKLKSVILDGIAEEILKYTAYPSDSQFDKAAAALTKAHPCLGELGSRIGYWGWKQSLKYKMANYRTKLGQLGCPEVRINSLKHKKQGQGKAASNIKKPRRAEVNYVPRHPKGITMESLEEDRVALLTDVKKKNNELVIKEKMERTFSYRREEVVNDRPMIAEFLKRWPALFHVSEVSKVVS